jgi:hypothetical protein
MVVYFAEKRFALKRKKDRSTLLLPMKTQIYFIPKTSIKTGITITRKETKPEKETNSKNGNTM